MLRLLLVLLFSTNLSNGELKEKMDKRKQQTERFLKIINQIESSGGTNFKHRTMQTGIHAGDAGIGNYGMMPNTVDETLNRLRMSGTITPDLQNLRNMDHEKLKIYLEQHPELEKQIAEPLAQRVLDRQQDEEKAAYSWHQGHNLTPQQIEAVPYKDNDYVKKFNNIKKTIGDDSGL